MSNTVYKTGSVPTVRYRILAIVFFLIATAGLFLGYLTKIPLDIFSKIFTHTQVPLISGTKPELLLPVSLAGVTKPIMAGSLLGYCITTLKAAFSGGLVFKGQTVFFIINELAGVAQVTLIPLSVLVALGLGIAACLTRHSTCRNCAMISGYLVFIAYLWPALTILFFGAGVLGPTFSFLKMTFSVDCTIMGIAALMFILLTVVTISRRKFVGLFRMLSVLLLIAVVVTLTFPGTADKVNLHASYVGTTWNNTVSAGLKGFTTLNYLYFALMILLGLTLLVFILRMNAKKFYPVEAVLSGLLFLLVAAIYVYFIIKPVNGSRWYMFTSNPVCAAILLGGTLLVLLLSILNVYLVLSRRRKVKAKRIAAELAEDTLDKEDEGGYDYSTQTAAAQSSPAPTYQYPYQVPYQNPYNPYQTPYQNPYQAPYQNPYQPAYNNAYQPQPAYQPAPIMPMPMFGMPPAAPVILQQAPATPPVVVLQVPPYQGGYQQPAPQPAYQPAPQYQPMPQPQFQPAPQPQPQPAYQPAPQPQPVPQPVPQPAPQPQPQLPAPQGEAPVSKFARKMYELSEDETAPAQPAQPAQPATPVYYTPAPQPQPQPQAQPAAPAYSHGPYDEFLSTLTDEQRDQFTAVFINKVHGDFGLPEYQVGGDNKQFFSKVFAALGKFRPYISPELLDKIFDNVHK